MIRISKQEWRNNPDNGFIRYVIFDDEGASVILEIYDKSEKFGMRAFMYSLWVDEQVRKQGKGTELIKICRDLTTCNGIDSLFLEFEMGNKKWVKEWYERNGYRVVARYPTGNYLMQNQMIIR